jgi:hypothetical protein
MTPSRYVAVNDNARYNVKKSCLDNTNNRRFMAVIGNGWL